MFSAWAALVCPKDWLVYSMLENMLMIRFSSSFKMWNVWNWCGITKHVKYKTKKSIFLVLLPKQAQQKPCKAQKDKP